ncbi:VacJ family lipoprotein [Chitinibacter fontanus]|uniref:VacJ family lipoprotein n=1 Tax=Chitinibacter fontanus TaxID=1737446 RepID=A0A7D5Z7R3_9NEIS|nr:VacJ family lipoprotein [Chitinibacter fontanus]QLI81822.1 VacJ family lipoprotein [Chitinibacter fontanus]
MRRLISLLAVVCTACATPQNNYDPLESVNRPIYSFNTALDTHVVRPVAVAYSEYIPPPLRSAVSNFFGNLDDLFGVPAALLQAKGTKAAKSGSRVLVNSTLGLGGLIDWASDMPIEKQDEDFGQVLGAWGVPSGPYLMVPFYGPLTLRDSSDKLVRLSWGPIDYIDPLAGQIAYYGLYLTDLRASLLPYDAALQDQLDPYAFVRDTYLQRRWFKVYDGNPPHPLPLGEPEPALDAEKHSSAPVTAVASGPISAEVVQ